MMARPKKCKWISGLEKKKTSKVQGKTKFDCLKLKQIYLKDECFIKSYVQNSYNTYNLYRYIAHYVVVKLIEYAERFIYFFVVAIFTHKKHIRSW